MASNNDLVFRLANLMGMGMADINTDTAASHHRPGALYHCVDAFGPRILKYVQNQSGSAVAKGELLRHPANTAVNNISAGTVTSATTTGLTIDDHQGKLFYVLDNDDTAGAAPEGETSIVSTNSATVVTAEAGYPFSVALAVNDDVVLISTYQVEDAADNDLAVDVAGVVVGLDGFADNNFGWVQKEGFCVCGVTATTTVSRNPLVAGAALVAELTSGDGLELWVGYSLAVATSDQAGTNRVPANLKLFTAQGPGGTP